MPSSESLSTTNPWTHLKSRIALYKTLISLAINAAIFRAGPVIKISASLIGLRIEGDILNLIENHAGYSQ